MKLVRRRWSILGVSVALALSGTQTHVQAASIDSESRTSAVSKPRPDKPAAPVEIHLAPATAPVSGASLRVDAVLTPRIDVGGIELRILPSAGLQLSGPDVQILGAASAGEAVATSFHLVPRSGGTLRVGVLVTMDTAAGRQTRPAVLALRVKGASTMVSSKPDTRVQTTPTGDRVVVFQGK